MRARRLSCHVARVSTRVMEGFCGIFDKDSRENCLLAPLHSHRCLSVRPWVLPRGANGGKIGGEATRTHRSRLMMTVGTERLLRRMASAAKQITSRQWVICIDRHSYESWAGNSRLSGSKVTLMNDPLDKIIQQMILGCLKWYYADIVDNYIPRLLLLATSPIEIIRL
jgi:hypothetical protein